jgi:hypothetical protein
MTTFSLPRTLVAGTPENINHVQENFVAVRDHINGNLDKDNFATSAKPSNVLFPFMLVSHARGVYTDALTAGQKILSDGNGIPISNGVANGGVAAFQFDPARYTVTGLTTKLRLEAMVCTNTVSPATTFTFAMHAIAGLGGGADTHTVTLNATPVTGSTLGLSPVATQHPSLATLDFSAPALDNYCFGVSLSAGVAADSRGTLWAALYVHWV